MTDSFSIDDLCRDLCSEIGSLVSEIDILVEYAHVFNLNSGELGAKIDLYDVSDNSKIADKVIENAELKWYERIPLISWLSRKRIVRRELDKLHEDRYPSEFSTNDVSSHKKKLEERYTRLKSIKEILHNDYGVFEHDDRMNPALEHAETALKAINKGMERRAYYFDKIDNIVYESSRWLKG